MTFQTHTQIAESQLASGTQWFLSVHDRATTAKLGRKLVRPILS